jgi:hypothetical protein
MSHSTWISRGCPIKGCSHLGNFNAKATLKVHLISVHNVKEEADMERYGVQNTVRESFSPQKCKMLGCKSKTEFPTRQRLIVHLKNVHKLQKDEVERYLTGLDEDTNLSEEEAYN